MEQKHITLEVTKLSNIIINSMNKVYGSLQAHTAMQIIEDLIANSNDGWVFTKDATPELIEDKNYSEDVLCVIDNEVRLMHYFYIKNDGEKCFYWQYKDYEFVYLHSVNEVEKWQYLPKI